MNAQEFLAEKGIFGLDTKKRYNEVIEWMTDFAKEHHTQQLAIDGVSNCINEKLVDWLCEDYTREEAIDQIETATIKEDRVFTVTYDNGKYDKVVLENNIIKIHEPR